MDKHDKKVIVNADDFALSESVNRGILKGWQDGIITSVSIMPCGQAFDHAVQTVKNNGMNCVGIHLVMDEEQPLTDPSKIPTLVNKDGHFLTRSEFLKALLFTKKINLNEVMLEFRTQVQKCFDAGLPITHIDGHGHIHTFPFIVDIIIDLAHQFGINKVRIPYERFSFTGKQFSFGKFTNKTIVSAFAMGCRKKYKKNGFLSPENFYGTSYGGRLDKKLLDDLLGRALPGTTTEIMTHPGYYSQDEMSNYNHWHYGWENELSALISRKKVKAEDAFQFKLISYQDI